MVNKILSSLAGQLFIVLLGLAIVSACSMRPVAQESRSSGLAGTHWKLKKVATLNLPAEQRDNITLTFTHDRVNGFNGCNRLFANYVAASDGAISFGQLGTTKMACRSPQHHQEAVVNDALKNASLFAISRNELNLMGPDRKVLLVMSAASKE